MKKIFAIFVALFVGAILAVSAPAAQAATITPQQDCKPISFEPTKWRVGTKQYGSRLDYSTPPPGVRVSGYRIGITVYGNMTFDCPLTYKRQVTVPIRGNRAYLSTVTPYNYNIAFGQEGKPLSATNIDESHYVKTTPEFFSQLNAGTYWRYDQSSYEQGYRDIWGRFHGTVLSGQFWTALYQQDRTSNFDLISQVRLDWAHATMYQTLPPLPA